MNIRLIKTVFIFVYLFLVTGCHMNNPLVLEMEAAYNLPSSSSTESNKHVAEMIGKRFPKGMKISDALDELSRSDFLITEGNSIGFRRWPDGEFKSHTAKDIKIHIEQNYSNLQTNYWANFSYSPNPFEKRKITVLIETNSGLITKSNGAIYSYTV